MTNNALMSVEVVYALPERQTIIEVKVPVDATVADAIKHSGILFTHPEIDLPTIAVGIFSKRAELSAHPSAGDRIEIYRPLLAEPKQSRHARVRKKRAK